jgi:hypothetical protein
MGEFVPLDDFDLLKEQVRELKATTPSQKGCLIQLERQGVTGPMAQAAVEAVFNEAKDAARQRREDTYESEDPGDRKMRKVGSLLQTTIVSTGLLVLAGVVGTLACRFFSPDAGILSLLHIFYIVCAAFVVKFLQSVWRNTFN